MKRLRDSTRVLKSLSPLIKLHLSDESPIQLKEKEKRRTSAREKEREKMLQKAKSIKKTLKTEAKAIAYGTERVDKRGKPVTSIADRTNVRCDFDLIFAWVLRCLSLMG